APKVFRNSVSSSTRTTAAWAGDGCGRGTSCVSLLASILDFRKTGLRRGVTAVSAGDLAVEGVIAVSCHVEEEQDLHLAAGIGVDPSLAGALRDSLLRLAPGLADVIL